MLFTALMLLVVSEGHLANKRIPLQPSQSIFGITQALLSCKVYQPERNRWRGREFIFFIEFQLLRETRLSLDKLSAVHSSLIGCTKRRWSSSFGSLVPRICSMTSGENFAFPEQCEDGSAFVVWDSGRVHDKDGTLLIK